MRILILVVIGWMFPAICSAASLGYSGVSIGSSRAAAQRKLPDLDCRNYPECEFNDTVKGKLVLVKMRFEKEKLAQIDFVFATDHFPSIKSALLNKRGNPAKIKDVIFQDASGARHEYQELIWVLKDGSIIADEYYFIVDAQKIGRVSFLGKGVVRRKLEQVSEDSDLP
jgi:hypothetical protein